MVFLVYTTHRRAWDGCIRKIIHHLRQSRRREDVPIRSLPRFGSEEMIKKRFLFVDQQHTMVDSRNRSPLWPPPSC